MGSSNMAMDPRFRVHTTSPVTAGKEVLALAENSGDLLWRSGATIAGGVFAPPIVADGRLYAAAWDHMVYAFALAPGGP